MNDFFESGMFSFIDKCTLVIISKIICAQE